VKRNKVIRFTDNFLKQIAVSILERNRIKILIAHLNTANEARISAIYPRGCTRRLLQKCEVRAGRTKEITLARLFVPFNEVSFSLKTFLRKFFSLLSSSSPSVSQHFVRRAAYTLSVYIYIYIYIYIDLYIYIYCIYKERDGARDLFICFPSGKTSCLLYGGR